MKRFFRLTLLVALLQAQAQAQTPPTPGLVTTPLGRTLLRQSTQAGMKNVIGVVDGGGSVSTNLPIVSTNGQVIVTNFENQAGITFNTSNGQYEFSADVKADAFIGIHYGDAAGATNLNVFYLNAADFGARTNLSDNRAAIQSALDAARARGIGSVYVPGVGAGDAGVGEYTNLGSLYLPLGMKLFGGNGSYNGNGRTKLRFLSASGIIITNSYQVAIDSLDILGQRTNFVGGGICISNGAGTFPGEDARVENSKVNGFGWGYIDHSPTRVKIEGNDMTGNLTGCILLQGLIDTHEITRNTITGNKTNQNDGSRGVVVYIAASSQVRQLEVHNNEIGDGNPYLYDAGGPYIRHIRWSNNNHERLLYSTNHFVLAGINTFDCVNNQFQDANSNALVWCVSDASPKLIRLHGSTGNLVASQTFPVSGVTISEPWLVRRIADYEVVEGTMAGVVTADTYWFHSVRPRRVVGTMSTFTTTNQGMRGLEYAGLLDIGNGLTADRPGMFVVKPGASAGTGNVVARNYAFQDELAASTVSGSDQEIQYNDDGVLGATNRFFYNDEINKGTGDGTLFSVGTGEGANYMKYSIGTLSGTTGLWAQVTETGLSDNRVMALQPYGGIVSIGVQQPDSRIGVGSLVIKSNLLVGGSLTVAGGTNSYSFTPYNVGMGNVSGIYQDMRPNGQLLSIYYSNPGQNARMHGVYLGSNSSYIVWGQVPNSVTKGRTNCAITQTFLTTNVSYFGWCASAIVSPFNNVSNSITSGGAPAGSQDGTTLSVVAAGTNYLNVSRVFSVSPQQTNSIWEFMMGIGSTVSTNNVVWIGATADFY